MRRPGGGGVWERAAGDYVRAVLVQQGPRFGMSPHRRGGSGGCRCPRLRYPPPGGQASGAAALQSGAAPRAGLPSSSSASSSSSSSSFPPLGAPASGAAPTPSGAAPRPRRSPPASWGLTSGGRLHPFRGEPASPARLRGARSQGPPPILPWRPSGAGAFPVWGGSCGAKEPAAFAGTHGGPCFSRMGGGRHGFSEGISFFFLYLEYSTPLSHEGDATDCHKLKCFCRISRFSHSAVSLSPKELVK